MDVSTIKYGVFLLREDGSMLNITKICTGIDIEEHDGELAQKVSVTIANAMYDGKRMSTIAKPNCYLIVKATVDGTTSEVGRGKITGWAPSRNGSQDNLQLTAYDELLDLESSQDNRYISKGVSTKTALYAIFNEWGIPIGTYNGPTNANAKTTYKNEYLADIILDLLEAARKQGSSDCMVRASGGKVSVLPKGSNKIIYYFEEEKNLLLSKYTIDTADMITVVKVVSSEEDDNGKQAVEAIVNGQLKYGKRQRIYIRPSDDSLAKAKAAAKEILAEDGVPTESFSVKSPDIPTVRKWDIIHVKTRFYDGYAIVTSISHDIMDRTMSMDLKKCTIPYTTEKKNEPTTTTKKKSSNYSAGDIVYFKGGYHYYTSMDADPRGGYRSAGKAYVEVVNPSGKHKYALIGGYWKSDVPGTSDVYGWVDENTVE